jgi:hypothetical protein
MQAFMLWMSGNSVQIFSVAITAMLMFSPIKALMNMSQGKTSFVNMREKFEEMEHGGPF